MLRMTHSRDTVLGAHTIFRRGTTASETTASERSLHTWLVTDRRHSFFFGWFEVLELWQYHALNSETTMGRF